MEQKIRNVIYSISTGLAGKNGVYIQGESMGPFDNFTIGTVLRCSGVTNAPLIDFRGIRTPGLENLKLQYLSGTPTCGIRVGDITNSANKTKAWCPRSITIVGFPTNILGETFAPDDSDYINCYIGNATGINVDNLSSQSRFFGGSIYSAGSTPIGVRINKPSGSGQDTSMQFFGTTFSGNQVHLEIATQQNINELICSGCWFESTGTMIMRTTNSATGIYLGNFVFDNCIGTVNSGVRTFMDLSGGRNVVLEWNGGTLFPNDGLSSSIVCDGSLGTYQKLKIRKPVGSNLITITNNNSNPLGTQGARGFDRDKMTLVEQGSNNDYVTPTFASGVWGTCVQDHYVPFDQYEVITARVHYLWTPGSTSSGIRLLYGGSPYASVQPASPGLCEDVLDISGMARSSFGYPGLISLQTIDDGVTPVHIRTAEIIYDW